MPSNAKEGGLGFAPPRILKVEFDNRTASATLSWNRALSGFAHYEILRQTEGDPGSVLLHRFTDIDDTTFTDTGLEGNTEYT